MADENLKSTPSGLAPLSRYDAPRVRANVPQPTSRSSRISLFWIPMNILLFRGLPESTLTDLHAEFDSCHFRATTSLNQLEEALDWPEVVFGNAPAALLARAPRLRWLQIVSSGFDEYRALQDSAVTVTTAHGVHAPVIAQHVLLMFLLFVRGQLHFEECRRRKIWDRRPSIPQDPASLTVGLVGFGAVGRAVARLLHPLGPRLIATKRTPETKPPEIDELYPWERLDELLSVSDHVILSLPLTAATRGVFNRDRLARLKPGAILHNISRGSLVDEPCLIEQLRAGQLGGAALDVFAEEPLPATSPLWDLQNVVLTPHLAGHHRDLSQVLLERFKANLRRHLGREPLENTANFARGY